MKCICEILSWRWTTQPDPSPPFLDSTHVSTQEEHVCPTVESCFSENTLLPPPVKFCYPSFAISSSVRLFVFVMQVPVCVFSFLSSRNIQRAFKAEGGLLRNSHQKRSKPTNRVLQNCPHLVRVRACVCQKRESQTFNLSWSELDCFCGRVKLHTLFFFWKKEEVIFWTLVPNIIYSRLVQSNLFVVESKCLK